MPLDLSHLESTLWLCEPTQLRQAIARVQSYAGCPSARDVAAYRRERLEAAKAPQCFQGSGVDDPAERNMAAGAVRGVKGRVGVIGVYGPIQQRMTSELMKAGGTSCEEISTALDSLLADKHCDAICLDVDSPGGSSYGTEELADKIFAARGQKKIYACANSMAASAAFWTASAASTLCCTPGGDVGSVGVYTMHVDQSKAMDAAGIRVSLIHAAKFKVEGNPFEKLDDEAKEHYQQMVDMTYGKFCQALARNRDVPLGDVRKNFGQGRLVPADAAMAAKMCDRVMTLQELIGKLTGGAGGGAKAAQHMRRLQQDQRKRVAQLLGA